MGSMASSLRDLLARQVWHWCYDFGIHLTVSHIPGTENVEADWASHHCTENMEWSVPKEQFADLTSYFGFNPNLDLFASRLNHKCDEYVSWGPDLVYVAVEPFTIPWMHHNCYMFPPFSLWLSILQYLQCQKAVKALVVAPNWQSSWMNLLIHWASPMQTP